MKALSLPSLTADTDRMQDLTDNGHGAPQDSATSSVPALGPRALADLHQIPFVDLRTERIELQATSSIPLHVLIGAAALPYRLDDEGLKVAVADPGDMQSLDNLRLATPHPIRIAVAGREDIEAELRRLE